MADTGKPDDDAAPDPSATPEQNPDQDAARADGPDPTGPPPESPVPAPLPLPETAATDKTEIAPRGGPSAPPAPKRQPVSIGTLINNNYIIREELKAGGMGEVYRGENKFTGDPVAIKVVLHSFADDPNIAALFKREARILGQLSDDTIVRYHNFVHDPLIDRYCLIMEFVSGVTLSDLMVENGPLPLGDARNLMRRIASGLGRAHSSQVVHRDLSPDNVMLRDGSVDRPVLIDFGIAKAAELAGDALGGRFAGKFKYVSPEQLGHFGGEIGPRSDVYGLALMIAAALRGTPIDMGGSIEEAVAMRQAIPELDGVPTALQPLLSHMLEPDPAHRPGSMADVIRLLEAPSKIPPRYSFGIASGPGAAGILQQPSGLRRPPTSAEALASPAMPLAAPASSDVPGTKPARRPGGMRWLAWTVPPVLILGGLAYEAHRRDLFAPVAPVTALPDTVPAAPAPAASGVAGFIANFDAGPCAMAFGDGRAVAALSGSGQAFAGLPAAIEARFEARPRLREQQVTQAQCAVLDFASGLPAGGTPHTLALDSTTLRSGGTISGRIEGAGGRQVWLALITAGGGVYTLSSRLEPQPDGSQSFSFGLDLRAERRPVPQLLLSVVSDTALVNAAAAPDGVEAAALLPLVAAEINDGSKRASVGIGHLLLMPEVQP